MDNFLADQRVEKRKYSGAVHSPVLPGSSQSSRKNRTGSNLGYIKQDNVSQRGQIPPQTKKRYVSADNRNRQHGNEIKSNVVSKQKTAKRKNPVAISFPQTVKMLSYPLGFMALTLIVWFLALNRDKLNNTVVNPTDDDAYQSAMAVYTGITGPLPSALTSVPASFQIPNTLSSENLSLEETTIMESAIPLDLMETFSWKDYTIQRGDSISRIAASYSLSMDTLIAFNGISNAKRIREGMVLKIPNMDGIPYTVQKGDSLSKISARFDVPLEAILDANEIESEVLNVGMSLFIPGARMAREDLKRALGEFFLYPIRGRLTSPFGWRIDPVNGVVRRHHAAIDLAAPTGTPIKAAADGTISAAGTNATFGKYVIITHSGGYNTMYAHLNKIYLNNGTKVLQGTIIGEVGNTGYSTGPHLHFGIFKNGRALNPLDFLDS